jgi:hypothetical protein
MDDLTPHYELKSVYDDGTESTPEVFDIGTLREEPVLDRRGFLGTGLTALMALSVLEGCAPKRNRTFRTYDVVTKTWKTETLPCGSPLPPSAVCTCNCVRVQSASAPRSTCRCVPVCTCNKVCTCIPVRRR